MAKLPAIFNPGAPGQEGVTDFSAIPPGDYVAHMISSEMKLTKENVAAKQFLECVWQVLQGDFVGRKLWLRLNLVNPSEQAVEIAKEYLKSICDAVAVPGPVDDSTVLHGKPCMIRVTKTGATSQYPEGNEIKNFAPLEGAAPTAAVPNAMAIAAGAQPAAPAAPAAAVPAASAPTPAPAAPPVGGKPPWLK